ncbi:pentapeptide repeat-containing protein [Candidatus Binatus sp.]|uniref:pentapeptide repeat-containing protein n=1 Tax=Candidatus Binatus sp. TaxID=2811406 RepID=UPI003CC6C99B
MKKRSANRSIDPPDLPRTPLEALDISSFAADSYELAAIQGAVLSDASASRLQFDTCVLTRIELDRSTLPNLRMVDVRVEKSSAANGTWASPSLRRVEIIGSRLTGLTINEGELSDVVFRECKADFMQIASSRIRDVRFENCVLAEAEFRECTLERVAFSGCDMRNVNLAQARLIEIDLRGSGIAGLMLDAAQLGSLTVDPSQAMVILQMLGAKVG